MKFPKLSSKDPGGMTNGQLNSEDKRLSAIGSKITDEFIRDGRGHERPSDWFSKTDPLSLAARALGARRDAIVYEMRRRHGPGAFSYLGRGGIRR